jgi:predicted GIY-YIG superfamily endonuclease
VPNPKARHHVYVVLLDAGVMSHRAFVDQNPNLAPDTVCLYVGMTGTTPEDRFASHKEGHKANRYVREYGIRLLPELYERLNPMTYGEAYETEARLADELRSAGYAVWQR